MHVRAEKQSIIACDSESDGGLCINDEIDEIALVCVHEVSDYVRTSSPCRRPYRDRDMDSVNTSMGICKEFLGKFSRSPI